MSSKVLLIGWDAADWKVIRPLIDAGKMPNLARMLEAGVNGNMATLQPCLSPMLWTSIATGKRAYKHGVHGFSEPDPVSGSIRPVTNLSRRTKAIWNILNQEGKNTITVGWWPSNPAEPLSKGVMVSNDFQHSHGADPAKWPLKAGTVHPESLTEALKELRFHPGEMIEEDLRPFLPGLDGMTAEELEKASKDTRMTSLRKIIADCTSIHCAATALMQNQPWDLMCVYYDAIDHFGHGFMKYHPPQRPKVDDFDYKLFHYVTEAGYRYHDMMLGTLLHLAGEETTVIIMSDHGFHPDDMRLNSIPREPAGPAAEHRQFGIFAAKGPEIAAGKRVSGINLLDICPTLLSLFGLPAGEDMDGKVIKDIYKDTHVPLEKIPSWDAVEGDHGMHPPDRQISAEDSSAALQQLVALGYIEQPDADQSKALEQTVRELDYNLSQSYLDGGIYTEAVTILERLYAKWPLEHRFGFKLASCYQLQNRPAELRKLVETIIERRIKEAEEARAEIKEKQPKDEAAAKAEEERIEAMKEKEKKKFFHAQRELFAKAQPNLFSLRYLEASADFSEKKYEAALEKLSELSSDFGSRQGALILRGETLQKLKRWDESVAAFNEALEKDREKPAPLIGLARSYLGQKNFPEAIAHAKASISLLYFHPFAHYVLGIAYYRSGDWKRAEASFIVCIQQAPLFTAALRMLSQISKFYRKDPVATNVIQLRLREARKQLVELRTAKTNEVRELNESSLRSGDEPDARPMPVLESREEALAGVDEKDIITIVSGLPRSGTSLMMQVLEAAGFESFTDGKRLADDSNQRGYYEYDKVMTLLTNPDKSWIKDARGKSLKVVAPLLSALPKQFMDTHSKSKKLHYRVIFMERPMNEILESQDSMLDRLGRSKSKSGDVSKAYNQQVRHAKTWIKGSGITAISVSYNDLVYDSNQSLSELAEFLGCKDKQSAMQEVIDPQLHRARANA